MASKSPAPSSPNDAWPLEFDTETKEARDLVRGISESRESDGIKESKATREKGASCVAYLSDVGAVEEAKSVNQTTWVDCEPTKWCHVWGNGLTFPGLPPLAIQEQQNQQYK